MSKATWNSKTAASARSEPLKKKSCRPVLVGSSDRRQIGFWETPKSDFVFVWKIYIKNIVASPLRPPLLAFSLCSLLELFQGALEFAPISLNSCMQRLAPLSFPCEAFQLIVYISYRGTLLRFQSFSQWFLFAAGTIPSSPSYGGYLHIFPCKVPKYAGLPF